MKWIKVAGGSREIIAGGNGTQNESNSSRKMLFAKSIAKQQIDNGNSHLS